MAKNKKTIWARVWDEANARYHWLTIFLGIIVATALAQGGFDFYKANISSLPVPAFDGTVAPLKESVDWVNAPASEWKSHYSEISKDLLVPLPKYDPSKLSISTDDLKWGDPADNAIRNMKITYSVPYMGNYKLSGHENSGSHLAVDIKVLTGTPVYSIASGLVVKASNQSSGFGKHVVIKHDKVPGEGIIYSSYSHLEEFLVKEGDVVYKGERIGSVGDTGTATTPHLHFQIDRQTAPWHPYWPFTSGEASEAGLSFFEAINSGLGRDKALSNTLNPMEFVQANSDGSVVVYDDDAEDGAGGDDDSSDGGDESDSERHSSDKDELDVSPIGKVSIETEASYDLGEDVLFQVQLLDENADEVYRANFDGLIEFELSDSKLGVLPKTIFDENDFYEGKAEVKMYPKSSGSGRLIAKYRDDAYRSERFAIIGEDDSDGVKDSDSDDEDNSDEGNSYVLEFVNPVEAYQEGKALFSLRVLGPDGRVLNGFDGEVAVELSERIGNLDKESLDADDFVNGEAKIAVSNLNRGVFHLKAVYEGEEYVSGNVKVAAKPSNAKRFEVRHDGSFILGKDEEIEVVALDVNGDVVEDFVPADPVEIALVTGEGKLSKSNLVPRDFVAGIAEVTFKPESESPVRIEVVAGDLSGESSNLRLGIFADVSVEHENFDAIKYLNERGVIEGYEDGDFKPNRPIARVEVLKMILESLNYDLSEADDARFSDVLSGSWYSGYLNAAVDAGIVNGYPDGTFKPGDEVNMAEFFKMLTIATGEELDEDFEEKPFRDVEMNDWFAPHAEYARKTRIFPGDSLYFRADSKVTRKDVAEALYRVLIIKKHGVDFYRSSLR